MASSPDFASVTSSSSTSAPLPESAYPRFREQFPQYADMPDSAIVNSFRERYYPDLEPDQVHRALTNKYGVPEMEPVEASAKKPGVLEKAGAFTLNSLVKPLVEDLTAGPKGLANYFDTALNPESTGADAIETSDRASAGMLRTAAALASAESAGLTGGLLKQMGKGALVQSIASGATAGLTYTALTDDPNAPDYWDNLLTAGSLGGILGGSLHGLAKGLGRIVRNVAKPPVRVSTPVEMKRPMTELNPIPSQERKPLWERMLEVESRPVSMDAAPPPRVRDEAAENAAAAAKRAAFIAAKKASR